MSDSLYSAYDNFYSTRLSPAQLGGVNRSRSARRDKYGRFLPQSYDLPEPVEHGKAGGIARAIKAVRDCKGRFLKD